MYKSVSSLVLWIWNVYQTAFPGIGALRTSAVDLECVPDGFRWKFNALGVRPVDLECVPDGFAWKFGTPGACPVDLECVGCVLWIWTVYWTVLPGNLMLLGLVLWTWNVYQTVFPSNWVLFEGRFVDLECARDGFSKLDAL